MDGPRRARTRPPRAALAAWLLGVLLLSSCAATVPGTPVAAGRTPLAPSLPGTTEPAGPTEPPATTRPPRTTQPPGTTRTTEPPVTTEPTTPTSRTARSSSPPRSTSPATGEVVVGLGDDGAIELGRTDAPVVIDVYEEPLCPPCATFAERYGPTWEKAVTSGRLLLRVRLAAFLDEKSASKTYSTRAIAALLAAVAYDRDPAVVLALQRSLFSRAVQPAEGAPRDLTDAQLAQLAARAGASPATVTAVRQGIARKAAGSLAALTQRRMSERGIGGTPAAEVGGTKVDTSRSDWLDRALG